MVVRGEIPMVTMVVVSCPECAADLELNGVMVGEIVQCGECGVELEVLELDPVELALAPTEDEDWGE
jgi:alpha-aminoadipate carrier protein LysW